MRYIRLGMICSETSKGLGLLFIGSSCKFGRFGHSAARKLTWLHFKR